MCVVSVAENARVYVRVFVRGIVQQQQPLGLLRNAFEVNHNEAFYLQS